MGGVVNTHLVKYVLITLLLIGYSGWLAPTIAANLLPPDAGFPFLLLHLLVVVPALSIAIGVLSADYPKNLWGLPALADMLIPTMFSIAMGGVEGVSAYGFAYIAISYAAFGIKLHFFKRD